MKNKIILGITFFIFCFLFFPKSVLFAAESDDEQSTSQTYDAYFDIYSEYDSELSKQRFDVSYTTDGSYYLLGAYIYDDRNPKGTFEMCWYNPQTGSIFEPTSDKPAPSGVTVHSASFTMVYVSESRSDSVTSSLSLVAGNCRCSSIISANCPVFHVSISGYKSIGAWMSDNFHDLYVSGDIEPVIGYDYWNSGNRYDFSSKYSSSVVAPEIRNAYLYTNRGGDIGGLLIRYLLPDLEDNSEYYTELWADIPTGYDSNGNVTYRKVCLKTYKASDILKINTVNSSTHNPTDPNDETVDYDYTATYGSYYFIKEQWSSILPMISVDDVASYGGITFYLRSSLHISETVSLVSDYAYFTADPNASKYPTIYNANGQNFDENNPNVNDETDPQTPNSDDIQYIGGTTDDPGISSDVSSGNSSGSWQYSFAGNWTISDLEDWVNSGFGLSGSNGLISFIGNCFNFLPSEFVTILMFILVVIAIVAIVKIVRGM